MAVYFEAPPPSHPTMQLFLESVGSLVFTVDDLADVKPDDRVTTSVARAESFLAVRLASGAVYYRDLIADSVAIGISQAALYRARRRMGLVSKDGVWGLPDAAVGSQK